MTRGAAVGKPCAERDIRVEIAESVAPRQQFWGCHTQDAGAPAVLLGQATERFTASPAFNT